MKYATKEAALLTKKEPFCLPVARKKTAKYSLHILLPLRFFNKHHTIQLPELFAVIEQHVFFDIFDIKIFVFSR